MARISINDWIIESFVAIFQWCGAQCAANRFRNAVRRKESMMKPGRNEIKFGLWMRAGIVGAMLFLIGATQLVTGEIAPGIAAALALVGALAAAFAWRARHLLDPDAPAPAREAVPAADSRPGLRRGEKHRDHRAASPSLSGTI